MVPSGNGTLSGVFNEAAGSQLQDWSSRYDAPIPAREPSFQLRRAPVVPAELIEGSSSESEAEEYPAKLPNWHIINSCGER